MLDQATFELGVARWDQLPTDGRPEIAFVGRSNVGKSSLLNALLNRKNLAYTSKTPGKTQQLNFFRVDNRFFAVDLPGYGYAKAPKSAREQWAQLQERYLHERDSRRGVVQLIDDLPRPRFGFEPELRDRFTSISNHIKRLGVVVDVEHPDRPRHDPDLRPVLLNVLYYL